MLNGKESDRYAKLARMGELDQIVGQVLSQKQVTAALFG